jgi:hypothetical protein
MLIFILLSSCSANISGLLSPSVWSMVRFARVTRGHAASQNFFVQRRRSRPGNESCCAIFLTHHRPSSSLTFNTVGDPRQLKDFVGIIVPLQRRGAVKAPGKITTAPCAPTPTSSLPRP